MTTVQENIMAKRISMINNTEAVTGQVTFLVGSKKTVITAHKIFLITASEVFEAMFSKKFETEGDAKIVVEDVEEDPFLQVIHYCYTLKVAITEDNMLGILYAAEKYMLPELMEQNMAYVLERIKETNCLQIFNASHLLTCAPINVQCLALFQDDPIKFLEDANFLDLCLSALQLLVALPKMNCTGADLKRAVDSWFVANEYCKTMEDANEKLLLKHGLRVSDFQGKQFHSVAREGDHLMVIRKFQSNTTKIQLLVDRWLFGVGLCMGVSGSPKDELVKLTITQNDAVLHTLERKVQQAENFFTVEIMFRKTKIPVGAVLFIKVEFEAEGARFASTHSICSQAQHYYSGATYYHSSCYSTNTKCGKMIAGDAASPFSCLAYLIYAAA